MFQQNPGRNNGFLVVIQSYVSTTAKIAFLLVVAARFWALLCAVNLEKSTSLLLKTKYGSALLASRSSSEVEFMFLSSAIAAERQFTYESSSHL